ncbi:RNA-guided endonuclease TnpB family protein [Actinomadura sp. 7K507]|uniref:RNA-guided endonuclease InsQ/TnpB family protein n=1 Tax=Actinomadura sp. 7K507 TaxID=2530365 RepID=UPI0010443A76|nr:RNA-guided endonuclease TnpB family protein [Actinomadura sp. 7K507]TDC75915.1 transposase [Actinomadura sp. 7K507]
MAAQAGTEPGNARYTYRLRVSSRTHRSLLREWDRCRWVWNQCVTESRAAHRAGDKIGPAALDRMLTGWRAGNRWLSKGASVPQQQTIRDFGRSRAKAIKDITARLPIGRRAGMPGFKKKNVADPTLNYTRRGFRLKDGRLHLAGGISVTVVWSRDLPGHPSSVRVYRDSLGHWYCSFVVPARTEPLPPTGKVIGVDWGVKEIATTTSDAHDLPHPEHGRKAADLLARYQRRMARRRRPKGQPGSKGYKRAARRAAKLHKKVRRQRQDNARKWAKQVVTDHDAVAVEDFRPRFLAKTRMARKAADGAVAATKRELITMAAKHGRALHLIDPKHTTTDCASCGARTKHALPLSERTYTCTVCGHTSPRDKNSAHVMLVRAGLNPAGVEGTRPPGPPGQEAA